MSGFVCNVNKRNFSEIDYPDESFRKKIIHNLLDKYPFLKVQSIEKSLCDRKIKCLQIGNFDDNAIFIGGAFHGMEWQTTLVLLKFVAEICEKIYDNSLDFSARCLKIIPCVNPDGVEIQLNGAKSAKKFQKLVEKISNNNTKNWQANARGVDLNHNFDAGWGKVHLLEQAQGIFGPNRTRYGGEFPESEPESKALTKFCLQNNFRVAFAFHSQGEEIYYDYGKNTPKESLTIAKKLEFLSNYRISTPEKIAIGAGFKDWFIEKFKRPAFTIEIGKGKNPLPLGDFQSIYEKLKKMLKYIAYEL